MCTLCQNTLKSVTRQNPVWYYADLDKGELKITADASNYYMMSVYKSDDLNTVLATSNYVSGSAPDYIGSYELSYEVETPGRYIMKLEQTNPIGAVVLSLIHILSHYISLKHNMLCSDVTSDEFFVKLC